MPRSEIRAVLSSLGVNRGALWRLFQIFSAKAPKETARKFERKRATVSFPQIPAETAGETSDFRENLKNVHVQTAVENQRETGGI